RQLSGQLLAKDLHMLLCAEVGLIHTRVAGSRLGQSSERRCDYATSCSHGLNDAEACGFREGAWISEKVHVPQGRPELWVRREAVIKYASQGLRSCIELFVRAVVVPIKFHR